jgi:hypothetical protein
MAIFLAVTAFCRFSRQLPEFATLISRSKHGRFLSGAARETSTHRTPFPAPALRRLKFSASDRFFKNDVRGEHRDGECEFVPRI